MAADDSRVLVVGGGIGGLSLGLALRRAGIDVTVLERAPELGVVGAGVGLWVDAMLALRALGVDEDVRRAGATYGRVRFGTHQGRILAELPVGDIAARHGAPAPVMVRRHDLLDVLVRALGTDAIRTGSECVGVRQDGDGVTVSLADGREEHGAVAVAADGIRSRVRHAVLGETKQSYVGYQYIRMISPAGADTVPTNAFTMLAGRGDRFAMSHVGAGLRYLFGVVVVPEGTKTSSDGIKADLLRHFSGFAAPVPQLIAETPEEVMFRTDVYQVDPLPRWTSGRVTLMGDAAHAMTPNMGRGAGEAVQDAVVLADHLSRVDALTSFDAVEKALTAYEDERRPKTTETHNLSSRSGKLMSLKSPLAVPVRNLLFSKVIAPGMIKSVEAEVGAH